jgi:hypothetical protein
VRTVEQTQADCDALYEKFFNEGYGYKVSGDMVRAALIDDHSCYPSILGPYCVICRKNWIDPNTPKRVTCPTCHGLGDIQA